MLQCVLELPETASLKDKRTIVKSLKDRVIRRYRVSAAEVDLQDNRSWTRLGFAVVSNSREHGEEIMRRVLDFVETVSAARIHDNSIHTEVYG